MKKHGVSKFIFSSSATVYGEQANGTGRISEEYCTHETTYFLDAHGYKYIPSHSNCFMIDTGRDGKGVIAAMREKNIFIGRTWPIWPNHVRISVGTPAEMARFQTAFKEVMDAPPTPANANLHDPFANLAFPQLS